MSSKIKMVMNTTPSELKKLLVNVQQKLFVIGAGGSIKLMEAHRIQQ